MVLHTGILCFVLFIFYSAIQSLVISLIWRNMLFRSVLRNNVFGSWGLCSLSLSLLGLYVLLIGIWLWTFWDSISIPVSSVSYSEIFLELLDPWRLYRQSITRCRWSVIASHYCLKSRRVKTLICFKLIQSKYCKRFQ